MDEFSRTKEILNKYQIHPKKSFGQNFLINDGIIKRITSSFDYSLVNEIIEIGPGLGSLSNILINKNKKYIAIDADRDMIKVLKEILDPNKVNLIESDFLKIDIDLFSSKNRLIIGNLPYNIVSDLLEYILNKDFLFAGIMVQKEFGDKLFYIPSKKENTALGLYLACGYNLEIVTNVDSSSFYPLPKVDSTFIKISKKEDILFSNYEVFKTIFKDSNKTIKNCLKQNKKYISYLDIKHNDYINSLLSLRARQLKINDAKNLSKDILSYFN